MELLMSLPGNIQDYVLVELVADVTPVLNLRLVSKRHKFEADKLLDRLTRHLKSQEHYWSRELQSLQSILTKQLLPPLTAVLRHTSESDSALSAPLDCRVVVAGMKLAGLVSNGIGSDYYPLWELRPERLPGALKELDLFHLSTESITSASEAVVSDEKLHPGLSLSVNRFIRLTRDLLLSDHFQSLRRHYLSLEHLQVIHTRLLRILMRLYLMKTNQFYPLSPLRSLSLGFESETEAVLAASGFDPAS